MHHPAPILRVESVRASLSYYVRVLGFSVDWDDGGMVSVSRGSCTLFLCEWDQGQRGTWVWIGVGDCEALHEELSGRGANIRQPPTNFPWAHEMQVALMGALFLLMGLYGPTLDSEGSVLFSALGGLLLLAGVLWYSVRGEDRDDPPD